MAEKVVEKIEEDEIEEPTILNGEWLESPPTIEETMEFLKAQNPTGTVHVRNYASFVVALSRNKNFGTKKEPDYHTVWNLYMTVAGRLAMFNDDAMNKCISTIVEPDPSCEPNGWIYQDTDRLVYRVRAIMGGDEGIMDVRYGTVWVPWTGGVGAVQSNRFEKAETSATGRALGAFGYGVLPGSGIASAEEMTDQQTERPKANGDNKLDKSEMVTMVDAQINRISDLTNEEPMTVQTTMADWVKKQWGKDIASLADGKLNDGTGDGNWWKELNEGQLALVIKKNKTAIAKAATE